MHSPYQMHWITAKRILRYVSNTQHYGLKYKSLDRAIL